MKKKINKNMDFGALMEGQMDKSAGIRQAYKA